MTADIRTAARAEAAKVFIEPRKSDLLPVDYIAKGGREGFLAGAVWAAARVTPTREQIEDVLRKSGAWCGDCNFEMDHCSGCKHVREVYAESVLRLLQELAEGESNG